jgi:pimeloyl-ACP methyl ester carboxylesterase
MDITHIYNGPIGLETRHAGPTDGEVVIMLHGFPECWNTWKHQLPVLAEAGYRVYAPNMRGYGLSSKPDGVDAYHVDQLIKDVDAIRRHSGAKKIHLAGHDWGAIVAWWYALNKPEHLASLSILNVPHPTAFLKVLKSKPSQLLKSWYIFYFQLPFLPELTVPFKQFFFFRNVLARTSNKGSYEQSDYDELLKHWKTPGSLKAMINYYRSAIRSQPKPPNGNTIDTPTQILWGERDLALSLDMAYLSEKYLTNGSLTTYPDATHWLAHDKPDEINQRLLGHFQSYSSR